MLENPERLHSFVETLARLHLVIGSNGVSCTTISLAFTVIFQKRRKEERKVVEWARLDRLPVEILIRIFSYLKLQDVLKVKDVCRRFSSIYIAHRPCFSRKHLNMLGVFNQ